MTGAPLPPGCCDPDGAAEIETGQEQPVIRDFLPKSEALARLHRQRHVEQVHRLGARVLFELVDELDRYHGLGDDLDRRLEAYAALTPDLLTALGGDRFPHAPLRLVGSVT
jgi:hypothetical protein